MKGDESGIEPVQVVSGPSNQDGSHDEDDDGEEVVDSDCWIIG